MGKAEASNHASNNNLYPQDLQLKLYQAFIFSIPVLFSIMLVLLFYLFYLKRRASDLSPSNTLSSNQASALHTTSLDVGMKGDLLDKLLLIQFDEELRAKDSQCCVCLGEFELKQEVTQVPYCRHVFHTNCIQDWLQKNSTCPLCRCHVITPTTAIQQPHQQQGTVDSDHTVTGEHPRNEHVLHIHIEPSIVVGHGAEGRPRL